MTQPQIGPVVSALLLAWRSARSLAPLSALSLLLANPLALAGEDISEFTEADLFADIPEVVSATRLPQRLTEAPASITVIDREQIEASGATRIADLFRLVPGMQVFHVTRNQSGVAYHGVSDNFPNRMEVMIDGRSIYLPLLSTVAWETIGLQLDDIDHIEVVRGSNVPTQGSNAFLGSINLVTRTALSEPANSVKLMSGNRGEERGELRHNLITDFGHLRISAGASANDGGAIYNEGAENQYINLSASSTLGLQDTIDLQLGASKGETFIVDADQLDNIASPRDHNANYQYLVWNHAASDADEFRLSFYHNYLKLNVDPIPANEWLAREFEVDLATATAYASAFGVSDAFFRPDSEHGTTEQYDIELQHTHYANESLRFISGLGYRFEQAKSDVLLDTDAWISEERGRIFANVQWNQTDQMIWNLGAMYEDGSIADGRLSPRLALNYLIDDSTSVRAARTRAYRMPSLLERHNTYNLRQDDANGNNILEQQATAAEGLKPGQIDTTELGFYKLVPEQNLQFDARLFHEQITGGISSEFIDAAPDLIISDPFLASLENGTRITKGNVEFYDAAGLEFQVKYKPQPETLMLLNYGHVEVDGQYFKKPDDTIQLHHYAPKDTVSLLISQQFADKWQASLAYYFMSTTRWFEGTSGTKERKAYHRADLQIKKRFALSNTTDAEVKLIVQNLLDERYQEFYPNNPFDRRAYVEFKLLY
ncbi:TonB-dependent receptor [Pontibacterium granulatum]|uniref:TonB-dependent receptor plug domain-containing protein n=1 Tax=Pontibacterium granulatum TaxID=2036029 RepID=UPI002499AF73|nr:TonB-dependent receptor [Pontibacterium granulatum]MDI3323915.1 TonB-dependent receptor [Pontibacterium granulatum]